MSRQAITLDSLHPLLAGRWSPRSFDETKSIEPGQLLQLIEAARWAPSSSNRQPSRFLVARRGEADFHRIFETLFEGNQVWAGSASALVVAVAREVNDDGEPLSGTSYDVGLAVSQLVIQAQADGFHVRQMGGFDREALINEFNLRAGYQPLAVLAIGTVTDPADLPEQLRQRALAPRERLNLDQLIINSKP